MLNLSTTPFHKVLKYSNSFCSDEPHIMKIKLYYSFVECQTIAKRAIKQDWWIIDLTILANPHIEGGYLINSCRSKDRLCAWHKYLHPIIIIFQIFKYFKMYISKLLFGAIIFRLLMSNQCKQFHCNWSELFDKKRKLVE